MAATRSSCRLQTSTGKERQRLESIEKIFQSCDIEENKHLTQLTDVLRKLFYKHV
jgi:hypothetical protein